MTKVATKLRRLNFACGASNWDGFENTDRDEVDLKQFPYPYEDESAEIVMMSHALFMTENGKPLHPDLGRIMRECYRILAPNGWLRIDDNPLRCWATNQWVNPGETVAEAERGYPDELRITRVHLHWVLLVGVGFRAVYDIPTSTTLIPDLDEDGRVAVLGNHMGHVSFTVEALK